MNRISKTNLKNLTSAYHQPEGKATSAYASQHLNPVEKEKKHPEFVVDWQVGSVSAYPNKSQSKYFF